MTPLAALATLALALAGRAVAQSSVDVNSAGVQFNLSNPGARSLALGGAFASSANDATAAYANPAGIVRLSVPEISIEARAWNFANFFTDQGRRDGPPTQIGLDQHAGLIDGVSHDRALGLSFFSLVYPIDENWAVAAYHHELANFRSSARTAGAFFEDNRIPPSLSDLALRITSFGTTVSHGFTDNLSVGLNVARYHFDLNSFTSRFRTAGSDPKIPGTLFGPPNYDPSNLFSTETQSGSDSAFAWNSGVLWRTTPRLSLGAVYRRGSSFGVDIGRIDGPRGPNPGVVQPPIRTRFHVPTAYGAGITLDTREHHSCRISMEADRVLYSSLARDFVTVNGEENHYRAPNGTEIHLGIEQDVKLPKNNLITLRVGAWRDPDHRVRYTDPTKPEALLFHGGPADMHVSAGFGLAIRGSYDLDVALDRSRRQQVASVSVVRRLPSWKRTVKP
jgi:hypothetical protein